MPAERQQVRATVRGQLEPMWAGWFAGLQVTPLENGDTLLEGLLPDQPALHGILESASGT